MEIIKDILTESWHLLRESSIYILFGLIVSGLLRVFLNPGMVVHHLGKGRFLSVFKAAILGIPIPLCSCGVLPAAASLKKQGANNGATTAFLISTPESGADSIAITYALLDPFLMILRPLTAFVTATVAGITENLFTQNRIQKPIIADLSCPIDGCCDGKDCSPEIHKKHHTFTEKIKAGLKFAVSEVWGDLVLLFFVGILIAGAISAMIPDDLIARYMGGGLPTMLIMLAAGIPIYICATASTPIAAALILKGISPGAALVFLIAGPATNMTSLTVLFGILGKRATAIYLISIAVMAVLFGLLTDWIYRTAGLSVQAAVGQATEWVPLWIQLSAVFILLLISVKPVFTSLKSRILPSPPPVPQIFEAPQRDRADINCTGST